MLGCSSKWWKVTFHNYLVSDCANPHFHRNVQKVPSGYKYPSCVEHTEEATAALKTAPTKRTKCGKLNMSMLWRIWNWAFPVLKTLSVIKVSVRKEQETVVCCRISLSLLLLTAWCCRADGIHRDDGLKLSGETPKNTPESATSEGHQRPKRV